MGLGRYFVLDQNITLSLSPSPIRILRFGQVNSDVVSYTAAISGCQKAGPSSKGRSGVAEPLNSYRFSVK